MGHQLVKFPINEQEGGCPEESVYGQAAKRSHFSGFPTMLFVTRSGVHPGSPFFPGMFGRVPRGGKPPAPVVPYTSRYDGELPMSQMPNAEKPQPWE